MIDSCFQPRKSRSMSALSGKNIVVVGATGGVGAAIVRCAVAAKARTLAVARGRDQLERLAGGTPGLEVLELDASTDTAPAAVFDSMVPDLLVICGGARPPIAPLHELNWSQFAVNWESDVRMSFEFCTASLRRPLSRGAMVIIISGGAGLGGSPISGGYAGAKRTQMFVANYSQKESDRLQLGIRFIALAPAMIMPDTALGKSAVDGYARYLGVPAADFVKGMKAPQSPDDVGDAVVTLFAQPDFHMGSLFTVSQQGLAAVK